MAGSWADQLAEGDRPPPRQISPAALRRQFLRELWREVHVIWPILSGLLGIQLGFGILIGYLERWPLGDAAYFTFVTGLTIGYGDLVPSHLVTRLLSVLIAFTGILLTGLVAAIGVHALQSARSNAS
jgi:Ion channel